LTGLELSSSRHQPKATEMRYGATLASSEDGLGRSDGGHHGRHSDRTEKTKDLAVLDRDPKTCSIG
jgi:hypothetical protein